LHIVARELASELNEARASLEAFGEQQDNLALLRKCNEHLHAVHGALRVAEVYGAALLAEEMGQVAHYLIANFNEKRHLGERLDQNLEILSRTAEKLEHVATTQAVFQLWWVVGAVLEALREGGLEGSASIKRLLGQADREMKRLYEAGEARYADSPPLELL